MGRPNNWPPIIAVTYSVIWSPVALLSLLMIVSSSRLGEFDGRFLECRDQPLAIELCDEIVESRLAAALDRGRRRDRGKSDDRNLGAARVGADRFGELEPVHARHLDVGDDHVELLALLEQRKRFVRRADRGHVVAGGLEYRHEQVAEERGIIDEQKRARQRLGTHFL